jgi:cytochrome c oxidase assembly factor CtaG
MLQGNFAWSGQISLFILFVASALFYMRELLSGNNNAGNLLSRKKVLFCAAMYGLHVLSGVLFYLAEYNQSELYW